MLEIVIEKREFYFIRHGQTDHNAGLILLDHPEIPLNEVGKRQAVERGPLIATLPIRTICYSPFRRARETMELATRGLELPRVEVADLGECVMGTWDHMVPLGVEAKESDHEMVRSFMQRTLRGINEALKQPGPVLIVAHGGIHWALSCWVEAEHEWVIDNCALIHFVPDSQGKWESKTF